jgi:hypothetical protein
MIDEEFLMCLKSEGSKFQKRSQSANGKETKND